MTYINVISKSPYEETDSKKKAVFFGRFKILLSTLLKILCCSIPVYDGSILKLCKFCSCHKQLRNYARSILFIQFVKDFRIVILEKVTSEF